MEGDGSGVGAMTDKVGGDKKEGSDGVADSEAECGGIVSKGVAMFGRARAANGRVDGGDRLEEDLDLLLSGIAVGRLWTGARGDL